MPAKKLPRAVREGFLEVFERLGGVEGLYNWAAHSRVTKNGKVRIYPNLEKFYNLLLRVMPAEVKHEHEHGGTVYHVATEQRNALPAPSMARPALPVLDAEVVRVEPVEADPFGEA